MNLYFEFEDKRRKAIVDWPEDEGNIEVHLTEADLTSEFPADLFYEVKGNNKVSFIVENPGDKRLLELQEIIKRRLQEIVRKT